MLALLILGPAKNRFSRYVGLFPRGPPFPTFGDSESYGVSKENSDFVKNRIITMKKVRPFLHYRPYQTTPLSEDFMKPYWHYVVKLGVKLPIFQKYSQFLSLRQSEIKSKSEEILKSVDQYGRNWLIKATYRAYKFLLLNKENYVTLHPTHDIVIGLHVLMLDNEWFLEFTRKNQLDVNSLKIGFSGTIQSLFFLH